ncbi:MAG: DUF4433 domain-containing protein [Oscillospiraceae bacterium]|nr:DUF4433 domain-containing protein [Oscillospiraceae bacterium]
MNLLNKRVKHITCGTGTVIDQDDRIITVQFPSRSARFQYPSPDTFVKFLKAVDPDVQAEIEEEIKVALYKEEQKKFREKEEESIRKEREKERIAAQRKAEQERKEKEQAAWRERMRIAEIERELAAQKAIEEKKNKILSFYQSLSEDAIPIQQLNSMENDYFISAYSVDDEFSRARNVMLKNVSINTYNLINKLKANGFEYLHHHTDFQNFLKIMKTGCLYSRNNSKLAGFKDGAEASIVERTARFVRDSVRFYYKEKTPTFYRNEGIFQEDKSPEEGNVPIPVALLFSEKLLYHNGIAVTDGNARALDTLITANLEKALEFDWETALSRGPVEGYTSEITRKRNAEFLYPDEVDLKFLKMIVFRTPADMKNAEILLGKDKRYSVDSTMFSNLTERSRYIRNALYDYDVVKSNDTDFVIRWRFINTPEGYEHKLRVIYEDGSSFERSILGGCKNTS